MSARTVVITELQARRALQIALWMADGYGTVRDARTRARCRALARALEAALDADAKADPLTVERRTYWRETSRRYRERQRTAAGGGS